MPFLTDRRKHERITIARCRTTVYGQSCAGSVAPCSSIAAAARFCAISATSSGVWPAASMACRLAPRKRRKRMNCWSPRSAAWCSAVRPVPGSTASISAPCASSRSARECCRASQQYAAVDGGVCGHAVSPVPDRPPAANARAINRRPPPLRRYRSR